MGSEADPTKSDDRRNILKALLLAASLAGALSLLRLSPLGYYLEISHLGELEGELFRFHAWAPVAFLLLGGLLIAMGAPRSIVTILGGMMFGFLGGVLLALAAALLGSLIIFWLTKRLGRPLFQQRVGRYLQAIEGYIDANGFLVVVLLRQAPLTCLMVNVLIGLTSISTGVFMLGSIAGLLPETVIFSLFGSSVREGFVLRVSIASFLLVLLVLAIRILYRRSPLAGALAKRLNRP